MNAFCQLVLPSFPPSTQDKNPGKQDEEGESPVAWLGSHTCSLTGWQQNILTCAALLRLFTTGWRIFSTQKKNQKQKNMGTSRNGEPKLYGWKGQPQEETLARIWMKKMQRNQLLKVEGNAFQEVRTACIKTQRWKFVSSNRWISLSRGKGADLSIKTHRVNICMWIDDDEDDDARGGGRRWQEEEGRREGGREWIIQNISFLEMAEWIDKRMDR